MKKLLLFLIYLFIGINLVTAQIKSIAGLVIAEEDGQPVVGASILVKGTTLGTITDIDGKFMISNIPASSKLIQVSYIGMQTQELPIKANMKVTLKSDAKQIDEVIVVAYGTAKKSSFTGAASVVGSKNLEKRVLTNATSALEGNAPGIQVTAASGQPGESASVRIRGFGSVNASNAPLYVVDGAIYNGSISDINPSDIESMSILKDAASTALYGSSAGNGVILITTKKGKEIGGNGVNLTINQGWSSRAYSDYAKVDIWDYYPMQWETLKNAYISTGKSPEEAAQKASSGIFNELKYNPFTNIANTEIVGIDGKLNPSAKALKWGDDLNWEDAAYKTGYRQEYNLSYNTKTEKSDTYASIGYLKDNGYMIKTNFERYSSRLNYNIYPTKWFKSGVNLAFTRTLSNYSTSTAATSSSYSNLTSFIRVMAPIYPVHKHDLNTGEYLNALGNPTTNSDEYVYDYDGTRISNNGRDAIAETTFNNRELTRIKQTGRTYITLTPIKNLELTANYALENTDYRGKVYENPLVGDGTAGPGRLNQTSTRSLTQTFNQLITYKRTFGDHNVDVLLGHENYEYKYEYLYGMKTEETLSGLYEFGNFVNISSLSSYTDNYKKESYFGRLNYDYKGKYYASASYRRDGSSRFIKENRWGNFWSFGLSWRINEENFMKSIDWVNSLKVRASYGETGNDGILDSDGENSYYPYQTVYGLGYKNWNEAGAYFKTIANPKLKWETQVSTDLAIEFGLFNRLNGTIEYFNKESKDLLFDVAQPSSTGVTSITQNIGKVRNSGVEIDLDYKFIDSKTWKLSFGANATFLKNKITKLPETMQANGHISGTKRWLEGRSIYDFWLRQWYGVNPKNGDGLFYLDTKAYAEASAENKVEIEKTIVDIDGQKYTNSYKNAKYDYSGSSIPKVYGGFNLKVSYKNFDLSTIFSYQLGGKVLDTNYGTMMSTGKLGYAMSPDLKGSWKKEGDITNIPRLDSNAAHNTSISATSTRFLTSSDYLNLRSVNLGYLVPNKWTKKAMLQTVRLNFTAENLFMIKARQGLNPMANYSGVTYNEYMPTRNFTLGLNVSF